MHIEKNVCYSIVGTLLNLEGKTKDNINSRFDMELMNIRPELHAPSAGDGKYIFHPARYTMTLPEKRELCQFLTEIKVPDGYSAKVSHYVDPDNGKVSGMKCHDCHVFLHRYLPLSIRGKLQADICEAIIELSNFFREICSKTLDIKTLEKLDSTIAVTLCKLEKIFPPSFFDVMMHLPIHLAKEAIVGGPVQYRWMYPIERYLRRLKSFVKNKAHPEGSIAEAYNLQECVHFCSLYLNGVESRINRTSRNDDANNDDRRGQMEIFSAVGRPLIGNKYCNMATNELEKARTYVLKNCEEVSQYANIHKDYLSTIDSNNIDRRHESDFFKWFKQHVGILFPDSINIKFFTKKVTKNVRLHIDAKSIHSMQILELHSTGCSTVTEELFTLARGPDTRVHHYTSYMINGWRFNTKDRDMVVKSQNSGIFVKGDDESGSKDYFGVLTDIVKLTYGTYSVVLFKCEWWDAHTKGRGVKTDRHGFTIINTGRTSHANDPYILATQAEQVYYVKDTRDPKWLVVVKTKPRDLYDVPPDEESDIAIIDKSSNEACQENEYITIASTEAITDDDGSVVMKRQDVKGETVAANPKKQSDDGHQDDDEEDDEDSESDGLEYIDSDDDSDSESEDDVDDI